MIGGGGTSAPSNHLLLDPPQCQVIVDVGPQQPTPPGGARPHRASVEVTDDATWVGGRDKTHSYGFASFDVDPDAGNGKTRMHIRVWDTVPSTTGVPTVFDDFTLERPRSDQDRRRSVPTG